MGTTGQPVEIKSGNIHVYEAYCDVCHKTCALWSPRDPGPATPEKVQEMVGFTPQYCDDHAPPPTPPEPEPEVFPTLTPAQLRIAARRILGVEREVLEATVEAIISSIPDPEAEKDARDRWDLATVIERTHPLVGYVAQYLGKQSADVDRMFREGANL